MWIWIGIGGVAAYVLARSREKSWDWEGESREAEFCGKPVPHIVHETKTKESVRLKVGVRIPADIEFRIAREGTLSRLLRQAKVGREVETGLANFDDTYEVQSEDPRIGQWLRESAPARTLIGRLFGKSVTELIAHGGRLWVEMSLPRSDTMQAYAVTQIASSLLELRATEPPARIGSGRNGAALWSRAWLPMVWTYGWATVAIVTYLGSAFFQYPTTVDSLQWRVFVSGLALLLSPVAIWLAARWLRDSIMARLVLGEFIVIGTIGFVFGAGVLAERGNIEMAWSPIQTSQVEVTARTSKRWRRHTEYFLFLTPFVPGETEPAKVKVDTTLYQTLGTDPTTQVVVKWRVGALGQPIVVEAPSLVPKQ
ncbi:MAG: hypothetical protein ACT4NL_07095 [Pseudomarimonas sp.]